MGICIVCRPRSAAHTRLAGRSMWSSPWLSVNPVCQVQSWASVISSAFCYAPVPMAILCRMPASRTLPTGGTSSIYLLQVGSHLGGGKQLPALQLAHLEQGGRGTHVDTANGGGPVAVSSCSQCQASRTTSNEVVQGVIWLLSDLGTDTGGKAKHSSNSSCSECEPADPGHGFQGRICRVVCDAVSRAY